MWQAAGGSDPRLDEMLAALRRIHIDLREVHKHLEWLDAEAWDHHKRFEGTDPPRAA